MNLTICSITDALNGDPFKGNGTNYFHLDPVALAIVEAAQERGYINRASHTQAEWTELGLERAYTKIPYWESDLHRVTVGRNQHGLLVYTLVKHSYTHNGSGAMPLNEPEYLKCWTLKDGDPFSARFDLKAAIAREIELNDWSRWNTSLFEGQAVEVGEAVYYHLLECVPPRRMSGNYFEVGEAHHHDNRGRAVHRACWMDEEGRYFTGYPRQAAAA